ncbi:MAG: class I SAM-dependent DNA methyltransferase [Balneolales bacterium]|nr:class I SAM-dependent DNA methyltransferase [Balneolales bacterium]
MQLTINAPRRALNKAFLKVKPIRSDMERFKAGLRALLDRTRENEGESEEFHKNLLSDFLKKTWYDPAHYINTKGRNDLVIHNGDKAKSSVGVIIEAKKPGNRAEMVSTADLNRKAFQELLLYYLRERITHQNPELKHLIITNINEWFIFDASVFEVLFAQNKALVKQFTDFEAGRLPGTTTDFFYSQIAAPFIAGLSSEITFAHFSLQQYEKPLRSTDKSGDTRLIALFKLLSPEHLLKLPFVNDSNSLDKRFYSELLHIIGLSETRQGGKKLIGRSSEAERNSGSTLEDTIIQLDSLDKIGRLPNPSQYGATYQERLFGVALELTITWINRVLFLKLLEAQLITYHKGDPRYAFLNAEKLKSYDDLNSLFFQVLARRTEARNPDVKQLFATVPYLNSSLFEPSETEQLTLMISNLKDDKTIPLISQTVLKTESGRKRTGEMRTLEYLFEFLNAYDFSSEGSEEVQEDNKALINASVLGLIFEKINGYKDGSFFTPGFITMYMCRETIRRAVVQKFNEVKGWNCTDLGGLYDRIDDRQEANEIVNSLKICDPAVGSGHFLVSALNELIAVKNDLRILQDRSGRRLKEYFVEVVNDELIVTDEDGALIDYRPANPESQRVQEALFHEKQTLIENSLFGVDINPNSVKICRLRLWIELLKHAYYKSPDELETLPNIDINIKCGNSLVSRFAMDADLKQALKKSRWTIGSYRAAVDTYRNAQSKEQKREMERLIAGIKSDFRSEISKNDPILKRLSRLQGELTVLTTQTDLFGMSKKEKAVWTKKTEKLAQEIKKLEAEIEEIKANKIYENAFEWRFEFPEVLNDAGEFVGFDVVIGNPPYIRQEAFTEIKPYLSSRFETFAGTADLFTYFVELGMNLLKGSGTFCYIIPNKWMRANYGEALRRYLRSFEILQILDFGDLPVFEEATTYPCIMQLRKSAGSEMFTAVNIETLAYPDGLPDYVAQNRIEVLVNELPVEGWTLTDSKVQKLLAKLKNTGVPLGDYVEGKIFYGIKTGLNEAFVIDEETKNKLIAEDPASAAIIKPFLAGRDIKRYQQPKATKYIIIPERNVGIEQYGSVYRHLIRFKSKLEKRAGTGRWYELQASPVNNIKFAQPKIMYPDISKELNFILDIEGNYSVNTVYQISSNSKGLLGYLNSKVFLLYFKSVSNSIRGGYMRFFTDYVRDCPIPNGLEKLEPIVEQILSLKKQNPQADTSALEAQIDQLVYQLYGLTEEEIKIVEGEG